MQLSPSTANQTQTKLKTKGKPNSIKLLKIKNLKSQPIRQLVNPKHIPLPSGKHLLAPHKPHPRDLQIPKQSKLISSY